MPVGAVWVVGVAATNSFWNNGTLFSRSRPKLCQQTIQKASRNCHRVLDLYSVIHPYLQESHVLRCLSEADAVVRADVPFELFWI